MSSALLSAYLDRVGIAPPVLPDLEGLRRLHEAHVGSIPFENLDILLGRGVRLDLDSLRAKLLDARRGGYCFEQNTLFAAVLSELGFAVAQLEARVRAGSSVVRPRTHMVLVVTIDRREWLADVGFGGEGLLEPVMVGGTAPMAAGLAYRVVTEGPLRVLQMRGESDWADQYAFAPDPVYPVDFEVGNWFTSTHPSSHFMRTLTAQRTTREVRYVLRYPSYTEIRASGTTVREVARAELIPLLRATFGIDLPADSVFPAIDSSQPSDASSAAAIASHSAGSGPDATGRAARRYQ